MCEESQCPAVFGRVAARQRHTLKGTNHFRMGIAFVLVPATEAGYKVVSHVSSFNSWLPIALLACAFSQEAADSGKSVAPAFSASTVKLIGTRFGRKAILRYVLCRTVGMRLHFEGCYEVCLKWQWAALRAIAVIGQHHAPWRLEFADRGDGDVIGI